MHEAAITAQLIEYLLEEARKRGARRILEVHLEIGELTHLNPEQIEFLYKVYSEGSPILRGSRLVITRVRGFVRCRECGFEGEVGAEDGLAGIAFSCPRCGGLLDVARGREFVVRRVRLQV